MTRLSRMWNVFWFAPGTGYNPLGLIRFITLAMWSNNLQRLVVHMRSHQGLPEEFFGDVAGLLPFGHAYPPPASIQEPFVVTLYALVGLAAVGLWTRVTVPLVAAAALYMESGFASTMQIDHNALLVLYALLVLSVAPGTENFSLDALIRWFRARRRGEQPSLAAIVSLRRGNPWGYRMLLLLLAFVYFAAGVAKIRYSDGRWITGETLSFYLQRDSAEQLYYGPLGDLDGQPVDGRIPLVDHSYGWEANGAVRPFAQSGALMAAISVGTVLFELLAPAMLLAPPVRNVYLLGAFGMHLGIWFSMNIPFKTYMLFDLLLFDWVYFAQLVARLRRRAAMRAEMTMSHASG